MMPTERQGLAGETDQGELLSIGEAADATGISVATIRVWERRYGKPTPVRLPSGHRRYRPEDVRWLRRVAEALARGHRPSAVVKLDDAGFNKLLEPEVQDEASSRRLDELIAMIEAYDAHGLREALLADWQHLEPRVWCEERMAPLIQQVGRLWVDGSLPIRKEHLATEVCEDVLRILRVRAMPPARPVPDVLLATLDGEMHDLGLQMVALLIASKNVDARLLGRNLPVEEIAQAQKETGARNIAISVSLATGGVATDNLLRRLRELVGEDVGIAVGGMGARGVRRGPASISYLEDLAQLASWLDGLRG